MSYRLTLVARRDVEALVRALGRDDLRAAERAVDELCATMEWLGGTPDVGQLRADLADGGSGAAAPVRTWALRDWLLVYGDPATEGPGEEPATRASGQPVTFLRVLEMGRPRWS